MIRVSYNRTILELKHGELSAVTTGEPAYNRTILELKLRKPLVTIYF